MKKLLLVLLVILVSGCAGIPLTQRDRDEFDKWKQQRDWERYDYRPKRPDRATSIETIELAKADEWEGRRKPEPKKHYYKPYPRRWYRRWHRRDRCDSRSC